MAKTLYKLMDWPEIETLIYSESDDPHALLGPHKVSKGLLVQAFFPEAKKVALKLREDEKTYPMELMEEPGFFAVLLPKKTKPEYTYLVTDKDGRSEEVEDPYRFEPVWEQQDTQKFNCGIHYHVYEKMGARTINLDGVEGVLFSVWAPNAVRVSVVGSFNHWDGRAHQMRRLWDSGIFELFIPGVKPGSEYRYELKLKGNHISLKADPYGYEVKTSEEVVSVVTDIESYKWQDQKWMKERADKNSGEAPISIYELLPEAFAQMEHIETANYRELAESVCRHMKELKYTHVLLLGVQEHTDKASDEKTFGYYAPTGRFGNAADLQYFIDYLHTNQIGVLISWMPIYFERNVEGLSAFDGTFLYEHQDERQGLHKRRDAGIFNYARPEVNNYLIANALFWADKYHVDGIMVKKADAVLYLDYNKSYGEWLPNMYGGNENLDGIEFFKHLNSIFKKEHPDVLLVADEKSGWPRVTGNVEDDDLGFDLKLNNGWAEDILQYMQLDSYFRSGSYGDLLMSMVYAYTEKFVLPLDWDIVSEASLYERMYGAASTKLASLRVLYGYMFTHPGKKLLCMGQEYAQKHAWHFDVLPDEEKESDVPRRQLADYVAALNELYKKQPALYALDFTEEGFEWINQISANENILVFLRKTDKREETLLIVCNFVPVRQENYKIGVPFEGKYKEIFNSDREEFGGDGFVNPRVKRSKEDECDGREHSIRIKVAPLSISVFSCSQERVVQVERKPVAKSASGSRGNKKTSLKDTLNETILKEEAAGNKEKQMRAAKEVAEKNKVN